ncbi:MAG: putative transposase [Paraglaciecola sp.]
MGELFFYRYLTKENRPKLYRYMRGILENKKCFAYEINGIEDHLHIIMDLHPTVALSNLVKDLKLASTELIKTEALFPDFAGWQIGYSAFTYSQKSKSHLINYVKNQEQHHKKRSLLEELILLLKRHGIEYDGKYLE